VLARLEAAATHLHIDAVQAIGRMPTAMPGGALIAVSSHKLGGPTGVGALVVPPGTELRPLVRGGAQERGRRAGTENVLGIVGFGAAARAVREGLAGEHARVRSLRDELWRRLEGAVPGIRQNGPPLNRTLPNTLNVTIPGISGEAVLVRLDLAGVSASLGSACAAGSPEASHVLLAMGRDDAAARAGLRLSLGWASSAADVDVVARAVVDAARAAGDGVAA
jgi:cysteine desulfurase